MNTETVMLSDGETANFGDPRPKSIKVTARTIVETPQHISKTLADIAEAAYVVVIGKDGGVGTPLTARIVIIQQ